MERRRRFFAVVIVALIILGTSVFNEAQNILSDKPNTPSPSSKVDKNSTLASDKLETLEIKGRASKAGYERELFGAGWADVGGCDMRNYILARDMTEEITKSEEDCTVESGTLNDPYTTKIIKFVRGPGTSDDVQIDHVVALSDSWQKGAQGWAEDKRAELYNDPLNLLAVDGPTNNKKGDADAATWLPPNKDYRCRYVARQIAVKSKYDLWITPAEHSAMKRVLKSCPTQVLPVVE